MSGILQKGRGASAQSPEDNARLFQIDPDSDLPIWVQLRRRFVHLINEGYYQPGDRIPTVRGLAADLSISYNTVNKAYLALSNDGYITTSRGRGHGAVVSCLHGRDTGNDATRDVDHLIDDCIDACQDLGLDLKEIRICMMRRITMRQSTQLGAEDMAGDEGVDGEPFA